MGADEIKVMHAGDRWAALPLAAIEDPNLTWKAKGLYAYLRSRPSGWIVRKTDLVRRSCQGRIAVDNALTELQEHGYISREQAKDENGRFGRIEFTIYDRNPANTAVSRKPASGKPASGKPAHLVNYTNGSNNQGVKGTNVPYAGQGLKVGRLPKLNIPKPRPANTNPHARQEARLAAQADKARSIPRKYQPVFDAFAAVAVQHKPGTKTVERAVKRLRDVTSGRMFRGMEGYEGLCRKITVEEIVRAIKRFDKFRNSAAYYPMNKEPLKKLGLADFLYNDYAMNGTASWFARCMAERPKLATDRDPELSASVQRQWQGAKGEEMEYETAVRVAGKLLGLWRANSSWYKRKGVANKKQLASAIMLAMEDRHGSDWGVGHLLGQAAEHTLKQRLERIAS